MVQQFFSGQTSGMIICYNISSQGSTPTLKQGYFSSTVPLKIELQTNFISPCQFKPSKSISSFKTSSNSSKFLRMTRIHGNIFGGARNTHPQNFTILHISTCSHRDLSFRSGAQDVPTNLKSLHDY
jgi:hypothetical protein